MNLFEDDENYIYVHLSAEYRHLDGNQFFFLNLDCNQFVQIYVDGKGVSLLFAHSFQSLNIYRYNCAFESIRI